MRVDHSQGDLKTSPSARFSNHPGRDQLSQVGSQINIMTSKHTLLYNFMHSWQFWSPSSIFPTLMIILTNIFLFFYIFCLMHTIHITYKIIVHDIYTVKIYARDVTTGDQPPMRLTSLQIDTSMFKKYII